MTNLIGPYELVSRLGHGGMGEVHRARHRATGELVALKTVRAAQAATLESIRREIHALAQLSHPGIVRIVAQGTHEGLPWYAMELLEGRTLRQHVAQQGASAPTVGSSGDTQVGWWTTELAPQDVTTPLARAELAPCRERSAGVDLDTALAIVARVCEPLAYLHGEGLAHRDLKPENVLVRTDGTPVLVDFGLSARFGGPVARDLLQVPEMYVGTPAYMSPEQVLGRVVDARSDLYALGCILYELVTGQPPFLEQPLVVMQMHVSAEPVPPSRIVTGIPAPVEELVMRLLAKEPRRRLGYASDVALCIAELGSSTGPPPRPGERSRTYLYRPALVGRQEPMAALRRALDALPQGGGSVLLVTGEGGAGKTRLLNELAQEARLRGAEVLTGVCQGDGEALGGLRRPLRAIGDICREAGDPTMETVLGSRVKLLSDYEPSLAELPGVASQPEPVALPPDAARLRLWSALDDTFSGLAGLRPLVLVLDDLHGADDLTLGFLDFVARARRTPILLAGSYRSDEVRPALRALLEIDGVRTMTLPRLSPDEVELLAAEMLALPEAPHLLGRYLARKSDGNPFFVAEYLRLAVDEGLLYRSADGVWRIRGADDRDATEADYEALPLPTSLRDLLHRRLQRVGPGASALLTWAAILGRESDASLLARLSRLEEPSVLSAVRELIAAEVLEPTPAGYRFTHDQIRALAYELVDPGERRERHHRAAVAIEEAHAGDLGPHLASLGTHWEQCGDVDRARSSYVRAGRRAVARAAFDEAERSLRAHLALCTSPTAESIAARRMLGTDVLGRRGRVREAEDELRMAVAEARCLDDPAVEAASWRMLGLLLKDTGRSDEARDAFQRAIQRARTSGDRAVLGTALATLAVLHVELGRTDAAFVLYEEALSLARETGNEPFQGATLGNMAVAHAERGRLDLAEPLFEQALASARAAGDARAEGLVLGNLAALGYRRGRTEEAMSLFERAIAIARNAGDLKHEAITLGNVANMLLDQGRSEEARHMYDAARDILRRIGARRNEGITVASIASAERACGRLDVAESLYREGLSISRAVGDRWTEGRILRQLGSLYEEMGRFEEASRELEAALTVSGQTDDRRSTALVIAGKASLCLVRGGDAAEAERLAREAETMLQEATDQKELGRLRCLLGHIALARGASAEESLHAARAVAGEIGWAARGVLARDIEALERAQRAAASGRKLVAGRCPQDLTEGQSRRHGERPRPSPS